MYRGDEAGVAVSNQRGSGMGPWGRRGLARIQRCRAPSDAANGHFPEMALTRVLPPAVAFPPTISL